MIIKYFCMICGKLDDTNLDMLEVKTGESASYFIHSICYQQKGLNSKEVPK